ncbi:MAG: PAS domain S-box protein [bacterium]|nr:PAS domain S-box protein [bacterium]
MFDLLTVILFFCAYFLVLFTVGFFIEKKSDKEGKLISSPLIYALSIAIYSSAWTFYGDAAKMAKDGIIYISIYLGPCLGVFFWWIILRKMVRIKNSHHITNVADFISARYNKSQLLAGIVAVFCLLGALPYIALQMKAIISTIAIVTTSSVSQTEWLDKIGILVILLMILFTLVFGVRRIDPTERHPGMAVSMGIASVFTLLMMFVCGVFAVYFLNDGFRDLFSASSSSQYAGLMKIGVTGNSSFITWFSFLAVSMFMVILMPHQFHMSVVENSDENNIKTAMWLVPAYLLLINIFIIPIAFTSLIRGLPLNEADGFALQLPYKFGNRYITMMVLMGGFSAATSVVMVCAMAVSTMVSNHVILPLLGLIKRVNLSAYILQWRWLAVGMFILLGYLFGWFVGENYSLFDMGMISFAAVLQFVPLIIGGIFWVKGNKAGAIMGLTAGFAVWFYTLFIPCFASSGWISTMFISEGIFGLKALMPGELFGIKFPDAISHSVFWSMFFNIGFYAAGSLFFGVNREERRNAGGFVGALPDEDIFIRSTVREAHIVLEDKLEIIKRVLSRYLPQDKIQLILKKGVCLTGVGKEIHISILELARLQSEIEKLLAGSIGTATAHKAMMEGGVFTPEESKELSEAYAEILADLKLTPQELKKKIDYHQEREDLLSIHAMELEEKIKELESLIGQRKRVENALRENEEKYRALFESSRDAIFITGEDGKFMDVNESALVLFGFSRDDMVKMEYKDIFVNALDGREFERDIAKSGSVRNYEVILRNKTGREMKCLITAALRQNSKKEILGLQGVIRDITEQKKAEKALHDSYNKLQKNMESTILAMARIVETKDPYTAGHERRVAQLAVAIAQGMRLPEEQINGIYMAGIVHDIGKIYVPSEILTKPSKLTDIEFSIIKTHPQLGYDILKTIEFSWPVADIVLQHHERLDGSGYPFGIKGDEILLESKIVAVADVVEAMSSPRPYRPSIGFEGALQEIVENRGKLYDPVTVDLCLKLFMKENFKFISEQI